MKRIIYLPEGHVYDELNYSGTPKYFFYSLKKIAKKLQLDVMCVETSEIINTEDIWRLAKKHIEETTLISENDLNRFQQGFDFNIELLNGINRSKTFLQCLKYVREYDKYVELYITKKLDDIYEAGDHIIALNPYNPLFDANKYDYSVYIDISLYQVYFKSKYAFLDFIDEEEIMSYYLNLEKIRYDNARYLFTFSNACKKQVKLLYGLKNCKTVYAGANIEIPEFISLNEHNKELNFLFVGRDFDRKGGQQILEAFAVAKIGNSKLFIVTSNENMAMLKEKTAKNENVIISGIKTKESLKDLYLQSDVFLFPTIMDAFGIACCEAMGYGNLIIATNHFAVPEILGVGEGNILIEHCNKRELCLAMEKMYNEYCSRKKNAKLNYDRVKSVFNWDKVAEKILKIIMDISQDEKDSFLW